MFRWHRDAAKCNRESAKFGSPCDMVFVMKCKATLFLIDNLPHRASKMMAQVELTYVAQCVRPIPHISRVLIVSEQLKFCSAIKSLAEDHVAVLVSQRELLITPLHPLSRRYEPEIAFGPGETEVFGCSPYANLNSITLPESDPITTQRPRTRHW
jgi:hypothetical protein